MRIECPGCHAVDEVERDGFGPGTFKWPCPECRRRWEVRTVFFEDPRGPEGDEWRTTVKRLRIEQGMTQSQLGDLLGISAAYISILESGKRTARVALCRRILEALGAHEEAERL